MEFTSEHIAKIEDRISGSSMNEWLNMSVSLDGTRPIFHLGFEEPHIGNPIIRAIHGGVVSTFMENAAFLYTFASLDVNTEITTTSVHTNYLRSTKDQDMHAKVEVHRMGRRFGFLQATSWQGDEEKPVAIAEIGIRIRRVEEE